MDFQLINGGFSREEAYHLLAELVAVKIRFHQAKISAADNEEDIKMREGRIKGLQERLEKFHAELKNMGGYVHLEGKVSLN
jgi:hypothetical protein